MITVTINGKERALDKPVNLADYIESLQVNTRFIAVAHNGEVLPRGEYGAVTLNDGDRVEIVRAVGGG